MFDQKAGVAEASDSMRDLTGKRILVTAGPTQEAIDPVRYITNHSTGRMGYAIAQRAHERGAEVVLVSGPVSIQAPCGVELVNVVSAQDMFEAVSSRYETCDAVIKAAAVADYRPAQVHEDKVKKKDGEMSISPRTDAGHPFVAWCSSSRGTATVRLSMETRDVLENSRAKLSKKNVDMICANCLKEDGAGFGTPTNHLTLISRERTVDLPLWTSFDAADRVLDELFSIEPKGE